MSSRRLGVVDLGRRPYREVLELQRQLREHRINGTLEEDLLLLVEHDPVYTMGRGTQPASLPESAAMLRARGADVVEIERGGDVTWHGHGQLVGYPILHLSQHREDLHWYLRSLELMLIATLAEHGLTGETHAGKTGVWVQQRKIASLGVHVRRWVTLHGFALNVQPDLAWFQAIVPCGIRDVVMTSMAQESAVVRTPEQRWQETQDAVIRSMMATFGFDEIVEHAGEGIVAWASGAEPCESAVTRPPFMSYG